MDQNKWIVQGASIRGFKVNYQLRPSEGSSPEVANADLPDNFAAHNWALEWVRRNAVYSSYLLERTDGGFSMFVLRTNHGQWYAMPVAVGVEGRV